MGHLKIINFPFVPNGKFIIFRCPKIWAHYSLIVMILNIGTCNNLHIPFGTNEELVVLSVLILKHFRVSLAVLQKSTVVIIFAEKLLELLLQVLLKIFGKQCHSLCIYYV